MCLIQQQMLRFAQHDNVMEVVCHVFEKRCTSRCPSGFDRRDAGAMSYVIAVN